MRLIVTKKQLVEYVERKKAKKIYYNILADIDKNVKYLNENVSLKNSNQDVIDDYKRKNLITPLVFELLIKEKIINENYKIL